MRLSMRSSAASRAASGFIGTGPVFFTAKPPEEDGMLIAGDAAGVIDPFSGQGIASALSSGILAARTLEDGFSGAVPWPRIASTYARAWRGRFRGRLGWSAVFRRLMHRPELAGTAARVAGARIVRMAMTRIS